MKNFLFAGLVMLAATAAHASILYWQVNASDLTTAIQDYNDKWKPATELTADNITGARLVQVSDGSESAVMAVSAGDFGAKQDYELPLDVEAAGKNYSYYIEIISTASGLPYSQVAKSEKLTYAELVASDPKVVYTGIESDIPKMSAWTGGTFSAAPEPTSGLLVLIGVGLLGLKRKCA